MAELISELDFGAGIDRGLDVLWDNGYPGRWLAVGRGYGIHEEELFLASSFGGRSYDSRNRSAVLEDSAIRLVAPGMTAEQMDQVSDAALVFYHSIYTRDGVFGISNGGQTRPVTATVLRGDSFKTAVTNAPIVRGIVKGVERDIDLSSFEPDDPINTNRIFGSVDTRPGAVMPVGLAVVRKDLETGEPVRSFWTANLEDLEPGQGWAVQTYAVNDPDDRETPVPAFSEEPYGFSMRGDTTDIAMRVRDAIGERTFASAVVRSIDVARQQFNGHTIINTRG